MKIFFTFLVLGVFVSSVVSKKVETKTDAKAVVKTVT